MDRIMINYGNNIHNCCWLLIYQTNAFDLSLNFSHILEFQNEKMSATLGATEMNRF